MGITGKSKTTSNSNSNSNSSEKWGMGLLLVFFSEDDAIFNKKKKNNNNNNSFSASSSSSSSISPITNNNNNNNIMMRRTNSNNIILTKTQSTISICALLVFITFLLFTLSTFEPTIPHTHTPPRRILNSNYHPILNKPTKQQNPPIFSSWVGKIWENKLQHRPKITPSSSFTTSSSSSQHALQGMGTLFLRGTRAMNDLIVVHAMEEDGGLDNDSGGYRMRLFLRLLHRSGLTSRSDIVFLFPSTSNSSLLQTLVRDENDSFFKLVHRYRKLNDSVPPSFDVTQYVKIGKKEKETGEPIWGKKIRGNYSSGNNSDGETELTRYGSVVGFDSEELDPENSLAGFFEHVPMSLRRWACYPMLLGRVRRNYKHIMLVDMKNILLLGDPLGRVRNRSPESVLLFSTTATTTSTKHARKNSDKTRPVNSAVVLGGARGVRRLSNAMLTEIVRSAMQQHKGKHSFTESGILNQLVRNEFVLKDRVKFISSTESIPDASSLTGLNRNSGSRFTVLQRGNSNSNSNDDGNHDTDFVIMKHICSFEVDSTVYKDCEQHKYIKEMKL